LSSIILILLILLFNSFHFLYFVINSPDVYSWPDNGMNLFRVKRPGTEENDGCLSLLAERSNPPLSQRPRLLLAKGVLPMTKKEKSVLAIGAMQSVLSGYNIASHKKHPRKD
jgi:hypothetical protein